MKTLYGFLICAAICAQAPEEVSVQVSSGGEGRGSVNLVNRSGKKVVAYAVCWRETVTTAAGSVVRSEGGRMGDVAIDLGVSAIGAGESKTVLERTSSGAVEYRVGAVMFEGGEVVGAAPWVSEVRERRALTLKIAAAVLEAVRAVKGGSLEFEAVKGRLEKTRDELKAGAVSAGGRRLCDAFVGDAIRTLEEAGPGGRDRVVAQLTRAQEMRLGQARAAGVQ